MRNGVLRNSFAGLLLWLPHHVSVSPLCGRLAHHRFTYPALVSLGPAIVAHGVPRQTLHNYTEHFALRLSLQRACRLWGSRRVHIGGELRHMGRDSARTDKRRRHWEVTDRQGCRGESLLERPNCPRHLASNNTRLGTLVDVRAAF